MYLIYYALVFSLFAIPKDNRYIWLSLTVLCLLLKCNIYFFDVASTARYIIRASLVFIFGIILLNKFTKASCYQSFILLLFLLSYAALAFDVMNNKNTLIYNDFEAVIYGLVACQFAGFLPKVWNIANNIYTNLSVSRKNNKLVEEL